MSFLLKDFGLRFHVVTVFKIHTYTYQHIIHLLANLRSCRASYQHTFDHHRESQIATERRRR